MNGALKMKKSLLAVSALVSIASFPAWVHAEDANPLSFNASLTSDYRFRGLSQSRLGPAIQGGADYALPSGFYVGTWLSSIKWIKDAGGSDDVEWDIYGGYRGEITKDLTYDVGTLAYVYPNNHYPGHSADTGEIYGALTYGPFTGKYSYSAVNLFGFPDSRKSGYFEAAGTFDVGGGVTLVPHIGHQRIANNSDFSYTDYSLTASTDMYGFTWSAAVIGTSTKTVSTDPGGYAYYYEYPSGTVKNLGRTGLVVSIKKTF
jgi:uncharacterized protein (TIGR02001 family)